MMRFICVMFTILLANLMIWSDSELIKAIGLFSIIFIIIMGELTETIAEKRND